MRKISPAEELIDAQLKVTDYCRSCDDAGIVCSVYHHPGKNSIRLQIIFVPVILLFYHYVVSLYAKLTLIFFAV